jgi:hypothetical protein
MVDFTASPDSNDGKYVGAETEVELTVLKTDITGVANELTVSPPPGVVVKYQDALSSADISGIYAAISLIGEFVTGVIAWDDGGIRPGSGNGAADYLGRDAKDGLFWVLLQFIPDAPYDSVYEDKMFYLEIRVIAMDSAVQDLTNILTDAQFAADKIEASLSHENYPEGAVDALKAEIVRANAILSNPLMTQREAEDAIARVQAAIDALVHDHPVKAHSHPNGVNTTGVSVSIRIKGHFYDVTALKLGDKTYTLGPIDDTGSDPARAILNTDGSIAGTIEHGSALVTFNAETIDALSNGTYPLDVTFRDFRETEGHSKASADNMLKSEIRILRSSGGDDENGDGEGREGPFTGGEGPFTGDDMNIALWIVLAAAALAVLLMIAWRRRKGKTPE